MGRSSIRLIVGTPITNRGAHDRVGYDQELSVFIVFLQYLSVLRHSGNTVE